MGRLPYINLYPDDWARDLDEAPLEIEGAWMRMMRKFHWASPRGELTRTIDEWAKILHVSRRRAESIIAYIKDKNIGDVEGLSRPMSTECPGNVRIVSRRMQKDEKERVRWAESKRVQRMSRECPGECPAPVPPMSSRSSSSSSSSKEIRPPIVPHRGTRKGRKYWESRVGSKEYSDMMKGKANV